MNDWVNKRITIKDVWPGTPHGLSTPVKQQLPEFCMRPRYLRDAQGALQLAHFTVDFQSGYLEDGWQGANFVPMGATPVAGIKGLPPWDPANRAIYQKTIDGAANELALPQTLRLEAVIPYLAAPGVGYIKVRLFYVSKAVQGQSDLVVVRTVAHSPAQGSVQGRQDGSGHGPPG